MAMAIERGTVGIGIAVGIGADDGDGDWGRGGCFEA